MAPHRDARKPQDHRLQQVLESGNKTLALLEIRAQVPSSLEADLQAAIAKLFLLQPSTSIGGKAPELDKLGTSIWNAAATLSRHKQTTQNHAQGQIEAGRLVVLLRVYAYLLVDTAHQSLSSRRKASDHQVRIFRVALKACRTCLDLSELNFAYDILQRLAVLVGRVNASASVIESTEHDDDDSQKIINSMVAEYHLLRMAHAWKIDRPDLVDHFYTQLDKTRLTGSADLGEKAADLFHKMAKSMSAITLYHDVVKWSERSLEILNACDVIDLGPDAPDLRLATTSTLVDGLIGINQPECQSKAATLIEELDSIHGLGNRVAIHLLRFNLLVQDPVVNAHVIGKTVSQMIDMTQLTEKSFKLLLHILHRARRVQAPCALSAVDDLIVKRLLPDLDTEVIFDILSWDRLEKAVVTFILFATTGADISGEGTMARLQCMLDTVHKHCKRALSAKATHAAHTLIWKAMGSSTESNAVDEGCSLLRHPIFANAGQINKAHIWRKAFQSALSSEDIRAAREIYFSMPKDIQNEGLTSYLSFRLALQSEDTELACESLGRVTKSAQKDPSLLFACVLHAQQSNMRRLATITMLKVLDQRPPEIHLPSLLRCTVRLLMDELKANDRDLNKVMADMLRVFEAATANIRSLRQGPVEQSSVEIQWWSKNSYNLAVQFCAEMDPEHLVGFLRTCMEFLDCYGQNDVDISQEDILHRKMLCRFLAASAFIVLGRAKTEDVEYSLQCYLRARQEISAFQTSAYDEHSTNTNHADNNEAMLARAFELRKFDLEAILKLQQWDQLDASLQSILEFPNADCWESAIDLLFTIHDHATAVNVQPSLTARIRDVLQKCTNESWKKDKDIHKMARWLRLIFTLHLESSPVAVMDNHAFALKITSQAASIAKRGYDGKNDPYPADELAWLATTAFNKGVDLLVLEDDDGADAWFAVALEMARYADDEGRLHASLTANKRLADERRGGRPVAAASGKLR